MSAYAKRWERFKWPAIGSSLGYLAHRDLITHRGPVWPAFALLAAYLAAGLVPIVWWFVIRPVVRRRRNRAAARAALAARRQSRPRMSCGCPRDGRPEYGCLRCGHTRCARHKGGHECKENVDA